MLSRLRIRLTNHTIFGAVSIEVARPWPGSFPHRPAACAGRMRRSLNSCGSRGRALWTRCARSTGGGCWAN